MVMLAVTINGVHNSAHAMQSHVTAENDQVSASEITAPHQCPCAPHEQHEDSDCCDSCINCACHAPLAVQPFKLGYNPIILDLNTSDTFKHLPEVYLSRFIPPQIQA